LHWRILPIRWKEVGYASAFVLLVLQAAGVPKDDPKIAKGLAWLKRNQAANRFALLGENLRCRVQAWIEGKELSGAG